jgi:ABC-2 type transport system permease protein
MIKDLPLKFYGFLKKDFLLFYKRKKYLYLSILLPVLIAGIFLLMLNPMDTKIDVGVCDYDSTEISQDALKNLDEFNLQPLTPDETCSERLIQMVESGEISLGLKIGKGFTNNIENLKQGKIIVYYDNTNIAFANLISWKVDQSLEPFEKQIVDSFNSEFTESVSSIRQNTNLILDLVNIPGSLNPEVSELDKDMKNLEELDTEYLVNPIWTEKTPIYNDVMKKSTGIGFIFPIIAMFVLLMLSSTSLIYDRKNGFLTRVKTTTSPFVYLFSKIVFFFFFCFLQFLIVLLLFILYGSSFSYNFFGILQLVLFVSIINTLIGLIIGVISENEGIAVLFSLVISFPLMLLSGAFFPLETMPRIIQFFSSILPLAYQVDFTQSVLLFGNTLSWNYMYIAVLLFILVWYLIYKKI